MGGRKGRAVASYTTRTLLLIHCQGDVREGCCSVAEKTMVMVSIFVTSV